MAPGARAWRARRAERAAGRGAAGAAGARAAWQGAGGVARRAAAPCGVGRASAPGYDRPVAYSSFEPRRFAERLGGWLEARGPDGDVVVSCRTRLARNVAGFPF